MEKQGIENSRALNIIRWVAWLPLSLIVGGFLGGLMSTFFEGNLTRVIVYAIFLCVGFIGTTYLMVPKKGKKLTTIIISIIAALYLAFIIGVGVMANQEPTPTVDDSMPRLFDN